MPVGAGIGAAQLVWDVMSPIRAAGKPPIITVAEPNAIIPGPAGMQVGNTQGAVMSVSRAAGKPPIKTLG